MRRLAAALCLILSLAACAGGRPAPQDPALSTRALNLEEYFDRDLRAWGQFQDRFGTVRQRFTVDIAGDWDGEVLTLEEDFRYDDGRAERRVWRLTRTGPDSWQGTADGVQGVATGEERGDTFNWRYTIDLPTGDGSLRVRFDDWMWLLPDDRLLNVAYMDKFGVELGRVIIFFEPA